MRGLRNRDEPVHVRPSLRVPGLKTIRPAMQALLSGTCRYPLRHVQLPARTERSDAVWLATRFWRVAIVPLARIPTRTIPKHRTSLSRAAAPDSDAMCKVNDLKRGI